MGFTAVQQLDEPSAVCETSCLSKHVMLAHDRGHVRTYTFALASGVRRLAENANTET